ncbi:MAG: polysaccharide deacetylase family protein [Verrucomicrobia bacterium]|nr:polysaccharide deacetylase family protein [Verrucomicrobiota bacterium]
MRTETEAAPAAHGTLAERLGFQPTDKILIINGDDAGLSHAASAATIDALEHGLMTSATIMMPCPWVPEIAAYARSHPQADFGLHLTHTSEWRKYRWGPVANRSEVRGLLDPEGYLWETIKDVYRHASPRQAEIEARAQIKKALAMGIDVTHLDSHMGALQYDLRYYKVYRKLALEFNVPIRMASQEMLEAAGAGHLREQLERDGIVFTDYLIHGQRKAGEPVADYWKRMLNNLQPGVTELYIHAALPADEMKEITGSWADRAEEYRLFTKEPEIRQLLETHKIKRIGYRALRDLQRKQRTNR